MKQEGPYDFFTGLRLNTKNLLLQKVYSDDKHIPEITAFLFLFDCVMFG